MNVNTIVTLDDYIEYVASFEGCGALSTSVAGLGPTDFGTLCCPLGPPDATAFFMRVGVPNGANSPCGVVGCGFIQKAAQSKGDNSLAVPMDTRWWERTVNWAQGNGLYRTKGMPRRGALIHVVGANRRHWETAIAETPTGLVTIDGTLIGGVPDIHRVERAYMVDQTGTVHDITAGETVVDWIDTASLFPS